MLTRMLISLFVVVMLFGIAAQGIAHASVPTGATARSTAAECMSAMVGQSEHRPTKKSCGFFDCLAALSGCSSTLAVNALPSVEPRSYADAIFVRPSAAVALCGIVTAPATAPPKASVR